VPIEVPVDRYPNTSPGLLLSLGDGTAIVLTEAMIDAAARAHPEARTFEECVAALIQQAQEARDADKPKPVVGCRCNGLGCRRCEGDTL